MSAGHDHAYYRKSVIDAASSAVRILVHIASEPDTPDELSAEISKYLLENALEIDAVFQKLSDDSSLGRESSS